MMNTYRLIYRRQFYLTPKPVLIDGLFNHIPIDSKYNLYCHPDLNLTFRQSEKRSLYLLGDLFDPHNPSFTNDDILNNLIICDFDELIAKTNTYAGRYVIVYSDEKNKQIFNDPATARKVFYTVHSDEIYCGSQPHVIAFLLNLSESKDKEKLLYFNSGQFIENEYTGILHHTIWDEIFQLSPNHYLDFNLKKRVRFWPDERLNILPLDAVIKTSGNLIKDYINAIYHRYNNLMLPVTAGMDSRLLLAASRDISQFVFYYVNRLSDMKDNHVDIRIGRKVVESLGLKYHILIADQDVDEKFKEIYFRNTIYPFESRIRFIYNVYFKRYPDYINLPGNFSEVARNFWTFHKSKITGQILVQLSQKKDFQFVIDKAKEWIDEVEDVCKKYGVHLLDLYYWENRMSNWGTHYQSNKDIAQEEVLLYNSRQLMMILLSTERKYRDMDICFLHRRIAKYLWKETLKYPVNPSFRKACLKIIKYIGIYYFLYMIKHQIKILMRQFFRHK